MASVLPGLGHLNPMVPLLRALADRGHEVEVVVPPPFVPAVERTGLRATGVGPAWTESAIDEVRPGWHDLDGAAQLRCWTEVATELHPALLEHATRARPDVIVHDHLEYAAWLVGEALEVPTVPYAMTIRGLDPTLLALSQAQDALDAMCEAAGRPPDKGEGRGGRWLYLEALPPSLTRDLLPPPPTVHHVRHVAEDRTAGPAELPPWLLERDQERPLVYVTLGTVFNRRDDVLRRLVQGAAAVGADVLVTVGENGADLDDVGEDVVVERYVPQTELYSHLSAVVCHGGFGTSFGAVAQGLPLVCAPIAADQTVNSALLAGRGAAINLATEAPPGGMFPVLGTAEPDPHAVTTAVAAVLDDPRFAARAVELSEEMAAGADPHEAAALVERVVSTGAPVLRDAAQL